MRQYQIETRRIDEFGRASEWTCWGLGDRDANVFDSCEEAEDAIESLLALGDDWATAEYRVTMRMI